MTGCRLNYPKGTTALMEPVELVDTSYTDPKTGKMEISYIVNRGSDIRTRKEALDSLDPKDKLDPLQSMDPRMIVWETKRPNLDPLPELKEPNATKQWIIS